MGLNFIGKKVSEVRKKRERKREDSANQLSYPQQRFGSNPSVCSETRDKEERKESAERKETRWVKEKIMSHRSTLTKG